VSDLPLGWISATLQDVATWSSGGTPSRSKPAYYIGTIPWFKTGELGPRFLKASEEHISEEAVVSSSAKVFPKGSVALAMYGATIGKTSIFGIDAATNQACAVGIPDATCAEFLYYFLVSQEKAFIDAGKGGAQPNISQGIVKAWPLLLPPAPEQARIVEKLEELLSDLDAGVAELKAAQKKLGQYRQSLLKAAVEGALTAEWRKQRQAPSPQPLPHQGGGAFTVRSSSAASSTTTAFTPLSPRGRGVGGEGALTPEDSAWLLTRARELRQQQTPSEQALWQQLRAKRFSSFKFRRQQPIGRYIVDFVCFDQKLIIELDGGQHAEAQEYDALRDEWLKQQGFHVLRFWNNEWLTQSEAVLESIWNALHGAHPLPNPSPTRREVLNTPLSLDENEAGNEMLHTPLSLDGRGAGGEGETGAQLLQRILTERRARWEAKQLAKFVEQGKTPPKDWQKKYPEPVQPDTSDLPELPEGWVWASVEQISEIQGGIQKQPSRAPVLNKYPFLRVANVARGRLKLDEVHEIELFPGELERLALVAGDVLIVEGNGSLTEIGRCALWDGSIVNAVHQNHLIRVRPIGIESQFVETWLNSLGGIEKLTKLAATTSGLYTLSVGKISKIPVPLAPHAEQIEAIQILVEHMAAMESQEQAVNLSLKQSTAQRQNILRAAFSGQLVPQDPNDEPASVLLERIRAERAERDAAKMPRSRKTKEPA